MIEVISEDRKKILICVIFKKLDIKLTQIELIQNIKDKTKKRRGIKMTEKKLTTNKIVFG